MTRNTGVFTTNATPITIPTVCVLAGGRGTRLGDLTADTPKPLLPVAGRPFLEHVLADLRAHGAQRVVLSIGYLAEQFSQTLGDGSRFGLDLTFVEDGASPAGTAGGVRNCLDLLGERFFVMYGDSLLSVDPRVVANAHKRGERGATMTVLPAHLSPEPPNCVVVGDVVCEYGKAPRPDDATHIDYGLLMFDRDTFDRFDFSNLSDIQTSLASTRDITACPVHTPYIEIGTPQSLEQARKLLQRQPF